MDILRRNTDYALRIMVALANQADGESISARQLASEGHFSYDLGCKILQRLHKAGLVQSRMGPKGGFALSKDPSGISLMEIVTVLQGKIRLNRCLLGGNGCECQAECEISTQLAGLQRHIDDYLRRITLEDICGVKTKMPRLRPNSS